MTVNDDNSEEQWMKWCTGVSYEAHEIFMWEIRILQ